VSTTFDLSAFITKGLGLSRDRRAEAESGGKRQPVGFVDRVAGERLHRLDRFGGLRRMKISAQKTYAVITGDIVDSSKLSKAKRQALPLALKRASRETRKNFPNEVPLDLDVFRGDGWQLLVTDVVACLRVALFFRACLRSEAERGRGLDTRMAIAIGKLDFIPGEHVSEGDGEAYRHSGRTLETLQRKEFLSLTPATEIRWPEVTVVVRLVDAIAQGWTGKQSRAVMGALRGWTQEKIARSWPGRITQPAVVKHLDAAQWPAVEAAVLYVEEKIRSEKI
jgi:hypothetical protein